jgi:hypothetical protein
MGLAVRIEALLLCANQQLSPAMGEPVLLAGDEASTIVSAIERGCKNGQVSDTHAQSEAAAAQKNRRPRREWPAGADWLGTSPNGVRVGSAICVRMNASGSVRR